MTFKVQSDPVPAEAMLSAPKPKPEDKNPDLLQNLDNSKVSTAVSMDNHSKEDNAMVNGSEVTKAAKEPEQTPKEAELTEVPPESADDQRSKIEILTERQKIMEKENKRKKELLTKMIAQRYLI